MRYYPIYTGRGLGPRLMMYVVEGIGMGGGGGGGICTDGHLSFIRGQFLSDYNQAIQ